MSMTEDLPEMDGAELMGLLFQDGENGAADSFFPDGNGLIEDWLSEQEMLSGMDTDDFLSSLLEGNDNMATSSPSHSPMGSDSGISDDSSTGIGTGNLLSCPSPQGSDTDAAASPYGSQPSPALSETALGPGGEAQTESPEAVAVQTDHCYSLLHGGGDPDILQSVRAEKPDTDVFIDLDDLDGESVESMENMENMENMEALTSGLPCTLSIEDSAEEPLLQTKVPQFQFKEIILTEEEKRLLAKEGATIPTHMPLTKAEERTLKKVRRKIRNKQSAQESRKKKKVYMDGLENRVAICTAHNQELQKKVQMLQKQNMSLIEQLRKLQAMVKMSTMKTSTTSTCVMVFLLSFCLIIFPSVNPFGSSNSSGQKELYSPSFIMSRSLLQDPHIQDSLPPENSYVDSEEEEEELLLVPKAHVENLKAIFAVGQQNHTPDYQRVDKTDSETAINSNSSSDLPNSSQETADLKPAVGRGGSSAPPEASMEMGAGGVSAVPYDPPAAKDSWIDPKPTSVILQQHRSDEM